MRKMSLNRIVELLVILSLVYAVPLTATAQQTNFPKVKEYRIERFSGFGSSRMRSFLPAIGGVALTDRPPASTILP